MGLLLPPACECGQLFGSRIALLGKAGLLPKVTPSMWPRGVHSHFPVALQPPHGTMEGLAKVQGKGLGPAVMAEEGRCLGVVGITTSQVKGAGETAGLTPPHGGPCEPTDLTEVHLCKMGRIIPGQPLLGESVSVSQGCGHPKDLGSSGVAQTSG